MTTEEEHLKCDENNCVRSNSYHRRIDSRGDYFLSYNRMSVRAGGIPIWLSLGSLCITNVAKKWIQGVLCYDLTLLLSKKPEIYRLAIDIDLLCYCEKSKIWNLKFEALSLHRTTVQFIVTDRTDLLWSTKQVMSNIRENFSNKKG